MMQYRKKEIRLQMMISCFEESLLNRRIRLLLCVIFNKEKTREKEGFEDSLLLKIKQDTFPELYSSDAGDDHTNGSPVILQLKDNYWQCPTDQATAHPDFQ